MGLRSLYYHLSGSQVVGHDPREYFTLFAHRLSDKRQVGVRESFDHKQPRGLQVISGSRPPFPLRVCKGLAHQAIVQCVRRDTETYSWRIVDHTSLSNKAGSAVSAVSAGVVDGAVLEEDRRDSLRLDDNDGFGYGVALEDDDGSRLSCDRRSYREEEEEEGAKVLTRGVEPASREEEAEDDMVQRVSETTDRRCNGSMREKIRSERI